MALTKRIGFQSTLGVDPAGGSTYDVVGSIVDGWNGPSSSAEEIETTVLADTYKTFCRGQIDPGELSLQIAYDPSDTDSQTLVDLYTSGDVATWQVSLSDCTGATVTESFSGWVKAFGVVVSKTSVTVADLTIRVSGDPGFTGSGG